ncbi:hypothetical protein ACFQAV_07470 [Companilactobacillus huachuanensis]|uniref:Uncharacterized protein n=1 Tax=Companilactobacillus huachuanensis TaxID=2559914 RepID=A0ABW1RNP1_9LACO|nr:hypothetical protein [Companilactobacillus huachuanensis]
MTGVSEIIIGIPQVVDYFYAKYLETPEYWSKNTWQEFIDLTGLDLSAREFNRVEVLLKNLITMLSDNQIILEQTKQNILQIL